MKTTFHNMALHVLAVLMITTVLASAEGSVSEQWVKSLAAETDGDYVTALEIHKKILPELKKSYAANLRAGWLFYMNEQYAEALNYYEKAAGQSSGALAPLYGAMNCHVALENAARAIRVAKAILVIDEQNYRANSQLAASYYQDQKFSLAAAYYRKLNRLYPEDLAVASGLAWSYVEQGEYSQAEPLFNGILMVSPDYAFAQRGLQICTRISRR